VLRKLLLKNGKETAVVGDAVGAFLDQFRPRPSETPGPSTLPCYVDDDPRAGAGHHLVEHRERPGQRISRVSRRARPFRVEMSMPTRAP
jgi:hypothetical protein